MTCSGAAKEIYIDVGLFLNTQWARGAKVSIDDVTAQARAARDAGFGSIWLPRHYLVAPMQMLQPMTLLGYLVRETGEMKLGMNDLLLPLLNPTLVAEEWATLDVLSGGRAVLGVGLGSRPEEFGAFGVPIRQRAARMAEGVQLIRRLWSEAHQLDRPAGRRICPHHRSAGADLRLTSRTSAGCTGWMPSTAVMRRRKHRSSFGADQVGDPVPSGRYARGA